MPTGCTGNTRICLFVQFVQFFPELSGGWRTVLYFHAKSEHTSAPYAAKTSFRLFCSVSLALHVSRPLGERTHLPSRRSCVTSCMAFLDDLQTLPLIAAPMSVWRASGFTRSSLRVSACSLRILIAINIIASSRNRNRYQDGHACGLPHPLSHRS